VGDTEESARVRRQVRRSEGGQPGLRRWPESERRHDSTAQQQLHRRRREVAAQVDLTRGFDIGGAKADHQWPAEKIGVDRQLDNLTRLPRQENLAPIVGEIGRAAFGYAPLPDLDVEDAFDWAAGIIELDFQWKRATELKHAMKADPRFDQDFRVRRRGAKDEKNSGEQRETRAP
jgi:hypothetical protein